MAEEAARADEDEGEIHEDQKEELRREGESGEGGRLELVVPDGEGCLGCVVPVESEASGGSVPAVCIEGEAERPDSCVREVEAEAELMAS